MPIRKLSPFFLKMQRLKISNVSRAVKYAKYYNAD